MAGAYTNPEFNRLIEGLYGQRGDTLVESLLCRRRPVFRFNPLKSTLTAQQHFLIQEGFSFEPLRSFPGAFRALREPRRIGKSLSHFLGHIYLQEAASMASAMLLGAQPGERVLDLCASPGSKTTYLACEMRNRGLIAGNDVASARLRILVSNLRRLGVLNTAVLKGFGEQLGNRFYEQFDRVLVDAPCSALGTIGKSPEVLARWSPKVSSKLALTQSALVGSGLKALKPGGTLVYSTCTIVPDENEMVVDWALRHFPVALEPISLPAFETCHALTGFRGVSFSREVSKAIRIEPSTLGSEAFFVARFRKLGSFGGRRIRSAPKPISGSVSLLPGAPPGVVETIQERFELPDKAFDFDQFQNAAVLFAVSRELAPLLAEGTPVIAAGLPVIRFQDGPATVTTEGSHLLGPAALNRVFNLETLADVERFANRETLPLPSPDCYQVMTRFREIMLGHGILKDHRLESHFPRAGWKFQLDGSGEDLAQPNPRSTVS